MEADVEDQGGVVFDGGEWHGAGAGLGAGAAAVVIGCTGFLRRVRLLPEAGGHAEGAGLDKPRGAVESYLGLELNPAVCGEAAEAAEIVRGHGELPGECTLRQRMTCVWTWAERRFGLFPAGEYTAIVHIASMLRFIYSLQSVWGIPSFVSADGNKHAMTSVAQQMSDVAHYPQPTTRDAPDNAIVCTPAQPCIDPGAAKPQAKHEIWSFRSQSLIATSHLPRTVRNITTTRKYKHTRTINR